MADGMPAEAGSRRLNQDARGDGRGGFGSGILGWFAAMRWLVIALLVSLGALLLAAAGVARHIWVRRTQMRSAPSTGSKTPNGAGERAEAESEL